MATQDKPPLEIDWGQPEIKTPRYESDEQRRMRQQKIANDLAHEARLKGASVSRTIAAFMFAVVLVVAGYGGYVVFMQQDQSGPEAPLAARPVAPEAIPRPPPATQEPESIVAPITEPIVITAAPTVVSAPIDPAVTSRLQGRLFRACDGVRLLTRDRDNMQADLKRSDMHIYGTYTTNPLARSRDGLIDMLQAAIDLKAKMIRENPTATHMINDQDVIIHNYNAQIANEKTLIIHNQNVLRSIIERLGKATAERDIIIKQSDEISQ